ncbi:MAG: tyrosine-type recombinase/integrase [Coriobacteriales bacterium]|jgi:integrase|nr:tyrosine-type recombinase/integrase [Coriobacteriales bacterium]
MTGHALTSIFSEEIDDYIAMRAADGRDLVSARRELSSLDRFLTERPPAKKALERESVFEWVRQRPLKAITRNSKLSVIRGFAAYLRALGMDASVPESTRASSAYVPYLLTQDELARIFEKLDSLVIEKGVLVNPAKMVPMLIRLLYGTGLRLGEALALKWDDIDQDGAVLLIRHAKGDCQRYVPISLSLAEILNCYKVSGICAGAPRSAVFADAFGKVMTQGQARRLFTMAVKAAGIVLAPAEAGERGICPHCLRHLFVMHSYLKMEHEGRPFIESSPYLCAYLGHKDLRCTDKYLKGSYLLHKGEHAVMEGAIGHIFPEAVATDGC